ncbi:FAS1 domain-containing protein [Pyrenochaeta sp. MPI-SDFR-AT-0127]|nr:FAS1 domain-containing protein [Pyrenochaeta sp. MPI-SDFR-AT-0127]
MSRQDTENVSLDQALSSANELSQFRSILSLSPQLLQALSGASNITILAPSNTAFSNVDNATLQSLTSNQGLVTALLQYHVLNGTYPFNAVLNRTTFVPTLLTNPLFTNVTSGQVIEANERAGGRNVTFYSGLLSNSTISTPNITFTGGIVHVVDNLLALPQNSADTLSAAGLTSLRGALNATSLTGTINNEHDLTIFAPSNRGIQNIASALANLSTEQVTDILTYHVVTGAISYSPSFENGAKLSTANGGNITITVNDGRVFVNNAGVIVSDILIANGVLHVIDEVLNPSNQTIANPASQQGIPAYEGATPASDVPFTSGQPTPTTPIIPTIPTTSTTSTNQGSPSGSAGLSTGAKAGIGVGATLAAALLVGLVYFFFKRRKKTVPAADPSGISELPDQDQELAGRKWYIGGKWRNEAHTEEKHHELDSTPVRVVPGPPAELDAVERSSENRT